jgi:exopolyphosphatase/guanosine-5'-triphosphate,3'-diphosphate pyrophosphatase
VVQKIREQTGIEVRIISGDEEAALIYAGVRKAVRLGDGVSLIVDIGGGSVEMIIGNEEGILWKQSFEMGAQRLLERFQKHDPILTSEINQLHHHFENSLTALTEAIQKYQPVALVGSSGTFDTLSEIDGIRRNQPISPESPETPLTVESFHRIYSELVQLNRAQRLQVPGMIEMRVDMIVVACCLIDWLIAKGNFQAIRVSSYSLKEGVLASLETSET